MILSRLKAYCFVKQGYLENVTIVCFMGAFIFALLATYYRTLWLGIGLIICQFLTAVSSGLKKWSEPLYLKPMSSDEVLNFIVGTELFDWDMYHTDEVEIRYYKQYPQIQLSLKHTNQAFNEPWAIGFPDPQAIRLECVIEYKQASIKKNTLISVDGARCIMPRPLEADSNIVAKLDYSLAKIFDPQGLLENYMNRKGFWVPE